jgi:hypothetical protein
MMKNIKSSNGTADQGATAQKSSSGSYAVNDFFFCNTSNEILLLLTFLVILGEVNWAPFVEK